MTFQACTKKSGFLNEPLPGASGYPESLVDQFRDRKKALGKEYQPRTKHTRDGFARFTNRLFLETSPYLLQHAHNPVDWYPWGDEAFEEAKRRGVPVFLSVGYSTCHWCHVMEEESFEDLEIARILNQKFVSVKVDREERPDVDAIYMAAVQMMTGHGGWPMSVFISPEKREPFFGGTYFPARDGDRGAPTGFLTLIQKLHEAYLEKRVEIRNSGAHWAQNIQKTLNPETKPSEVKIEVLDKAANFYLQRFDPVNGGVRGAPKFPSSMPVRFLLRYAQRKKSKEVEKAAEKTLEKMALGGMYDHVAGGFHRYSTDEDWLVPHFEKMLYDNALLIEAYLEGFQVTGNVFFREVAEDIVDYVSREMTSSEGAFFSATDADSIGPRGHREEGYYFTWTPEEVQKTLGKEALEFSKLFDVTEKGNFEGRSILNLKEIPLESVRKKARELKKKLYEVRSLRPAPIRDEKIIVAWNALMISAFAHAGWLLKQPEVLSRATKAGDFIWTQLFNKDRLNRIYKDGESKQLGFLDDHSFLVAAYLDLLETTGDVKWFERAKKIDEIIKKDFEDLKGGAFQTGKNHEALLAREKPDYDGAVPSGNSIHGLNLLRLYELTAQDEYRKRAELLFKALGTRLADHPAAMSELLVALEFRFGGAKEIVVATPKGKSETAEPFLDLLREKYFPHRTLLILEGESEGIPLGAGKQPLDGKATAFVCENHICKLPTSDLQEFKKQVFGSP